MSDNFYLFKEKLDQALRLIEISSESKNKKKPMLSNDKLVDTQSLLNRCEEVCNSYQKNKPTLRIVHHLACSGGTLISKCISSMPNVYLLSEVHPFTDLGIDRDNPRYAPSDISSLAKYAKIPKQRELAGKIFRRSIDEAYQHVENIGGILVLRDHTHADFNTEEAIPSISSTIDLLRRDYNVKSILTIRNPIDSYSSLVRNGWVHFKPQTFDEYCKRFFILLGQFKQNQVFKYEDFVDCPQQQMKLMSQALELPFDEQFEDIFGVFKITGDSGMSSDKISPRKSLSGLNDILDNEVFERYKAIKVYSNS
ncbi:TPA: hypothetical protein NJZ47_002254 [Vibrio parahaemolyticus]|nr:hypothetical protein [Vibrio parahaemolyticus]